MSMMVPLSFVPGRQLAPQSVLGFQHPLKDRGLDDHRCAGLLFHLRCQVGRHQRRHPARPGDPSVALLVGEAEHQCLGPSALNQPAFPFLDRQLLVLRLVDRQRGAGFQVR